MKILVMEDDGQLVSEAWQEQRKDRHDAGTGVSETKSVKTSPEPEHPVKAPVDNRFWCEP